MRSGSGEFGGIVYGRKFGGDIDVEKVDGISTRAAGRERGRGLMSLECNDRM